jgi:hypothetical protein
LGDGKLELAQSRRRAAYVWKSHIVVRRRQTPRGSKPRTSHGSLVRSWQLNLFSPSVSKVVQMMCLSEPEGVSYYSKDWELRKLYTYDVMTPTHLNWGKGTIGTIRHLHVALSTASLHFVTRKCGTVVFALRGAGGCQCTYSYSCARTHSYKTRNERGRVRARIYRGLGGSWSSVSCTCAGPHPSKSLICEIR